MTEDSKTDLLAIARQALALAANASPAPWDSKSARDDSTGLFHPGRAVHSMQRMRHETYAANFDDPYQKVQPFLVCQGPELSAYNPETEEKQQIADMAFIAFARTALPRLAAQVVRLTQENERLKTKPEAVTAE